MTLRMLLSFTKPFTIWIILGTTLLVAMTNCSLYRFSDATRVYYCTNIECSEKWGHWKISANMTSLEAINHSLVVTCTYE